MPPRRTTPEGSRARFPAYLDDPTYEALRQRVHEERRTFAEWVLEAIQEKLRRPARKPRT